MNSMQKQQLGLAVSTAILIALTANNASAQDGATDEVGDVVVEEVVVTGSRIQKSGFDSSSPISVYDSDDVMMAGNASLDEFLKEIPQITGFQLGASTNNGSDGNTKVELRGLGFNRTLTLINGRRTVGDASGDGAVDLNTIPTAMIKRVELLTDGASTIYGSDAMAGVINFVLNDDFEGFKFTADYGTATDEMDAENQGISILAGAGSDRGHVVVSASWRNQDEIQQGDRDWALEPLYPQIQSDGSLALEGSGSSNSRKIRVPGQGNWIFDEALGEARPFESGDVYNYAPVNALTQPFEVWQLGGIGRIEIVDGVEGYMEATFTSRTSQQRLAPDASFAVNPSVQTPNNGLQYNDWVPANNPYNPFGSVNCANQLGLCDSDVRINRRFQESGGRLFAQSSDTFRVLTGLRGEVASINWDVSYLYSYNDTVDETKNYGRFDRWAVAVDPEACAANGSCPGVLNPFGEFGSISPEQMDFLTTGSLKDLIDSDLEVIAINLDGSLFELGGGDMGWALGYEHRRESGSYSPDEFLSEGLTTGGAAGPLNGSFSVDEVYGELYVPVTAALALEASVRHSDYDTVGTNTSYKFGADWKVLESLRIRATYGTGFRAPNISELNTTVSSGFPIANSPCELGDRALAAGEISQVTYDNCQAVGFDTSDAGEYGFAWQSYYEVSAPTGGLEAEESTSFTVGGVFEPEFAQGLRLSVDYWSIEVENVIGSPRFNTLFNSCMGSQGFSSAACGAFDEYGLDYFGFPGDAVAQFGNLGTLETDGVDFAAVYDLALGGVVQGLKFGVNGTWTNSYTENYALGGEIELAGTAEGLAGVYPEWRVNFNADVYGNNWTAGYSLRFIDKTEDLWRAPSTSSDVVAESITYHDITATFTWGALRLVAGINNLTDETPPYFHSAFNANTEPGTYDVLGRRLFTSLELQF